MLRRHRQQIVSCWLFLKDVSGGRYISPITKSHSAFTAFVMLAALLLPLKA